MIRLVRNKYKTCSEITTLRYLNYSIKLVKICVKENLLNFIRNRGTHEQLHTMSY